MSGVLFLHGAKVNVTNLADWSRCPIAKNCPGGQVEAGRNEKAGCVILHGRVATEFATLTFIKGAKGCSKTVTVTSFTVAARLSN